MRAEQRRERKIVWTPSQKDAIETRNGDVFVSAGAGSGKTAVLVERCLSLATDVRDPVSLLSLLVVTFTEAAAAEMRVRLRKALRQRLIGNPADPVLCERLDELDRAQISTIDSFCHRILREHFHILGIDPAFTVTDENQSAVLQNRILEEVLERWYGIDGDQGDLFRLLVESYGGRRGHESLGPALLKVHAFLETLQDPNDWVTAVRRTHAAPAGPDRPTGWVQPFLEVLARELTAVAADLEAAVRLAQETGCDAYGDHAAGILGTVDGWMARIRDGDAPAVVNAISGYQPPRLPSLRKALTPLAARTRDLVTGAKARLRAGIRDQLCPAPFIDLQLSSEHVAPLATVFCDVLEDFRETYREAKRERLVLDFADLEQLALRILRAQDSPPRNPLPSPVAREYRERFRCILVDEYQDTSPIQDAILSLVSRTFDPERRNNRFLVGDVKQCIYGFRQAEPRCFREKVEAAARPGGNGSRTILLRENFRSRKAVIRAINDLFTPVMRRDLGGVDYDESAQLVFHAEHLPGQGQTGPHTEVHFLERNLDAPAADQGDEEEEVRADDGDRTPLLELDAAEREAAWVARRIRSMIGEDGRGRPEFEVWDSGSEASRPVQYRDITVLLRTTRHKARIYAQEFQRLGVPVFADTQSGLFDALEIQDALALLQILRSPLDDIALAALLRSPLIGWSESDLARVRLVEGGTPHFWNAVEAAARQRDDGVAREKCRERLALLTEWRERLRSRNTSQVLEEILTENGYLAFVEGLPAGAQRRANLLHFVNLVRRAESGGRRGIQAVLDFLHALGELDRDLGTAQPLPVSENVVRLMSIHRSKGLEFPVVFVPDLGKHFNLSDTRGDLLVHRDAGLALKGVDLDARERYPTPMCAVLSDALRRDLLDEEMRILYVALTRARERLVLTASADLARDPENWLRRGGRDAAPHVHRTAGRPIDWIAAVLVDHPDGGALRGDLSCIEEAKTSVGEVFSVTLHPRPEMAALMAAEAWPISPGGRASAGSLAQLAAQAARQPSDAAAAALKRLEWRYAHAASTRYPARIRVTSLENAPHREEAESGEEKTRYEPPWPRTPRFMAEKAELTALERGAAVHRFLELLDLSRPLTQKDLNAQADAFVAGAMLDARERSQLMIPSLAEFFSGPVGRRIRARPSSVRRELPFTQAVPAVHIDGRNAPPGETVLVQGIIDCLVPEKDGFLLVDYKTDRVTVEQLPERLESYRPQIAAYRRAVKTLLRRPVKDCYIVFLEARRVERVK